MEGVFGAAPVRGGVLESSLLGAEVSEFGVASFAETSLFSCAFVWTGDISLEIGVVTSEESSGGGDGGVDEGGDMESILETPVGLVKG